MLVSGRYYNSEKYRFGFNGKESDPEWKGTTGAVYDYGFRIYDARVAKFLSVDPLTRDYPWYTPYQFAGNTPIQAIDLDGLEPKIVTESAKKAGYKPCFHISTDKKTARTFIVKTEILVHDISDDYESGSFNIVQTKFNIDEKGSVHAIREERSTYSFSESGVVEEKFKPILNRKPIKKYDNEAQEYVKRNEPLVNEYANLVKENPEKVKSGKMNYNTWSTSEIVEDALNFVQDATEAYFLPWWTSPPGTDDGYLPNRSNSITEEYEVTLEQEEDASKYFKEQKKEKSTIYHK